MAAFTHTAADGRLVFHGPDGHEIVVASGKPFETDDPAVVAFLDQHPAVKRAGKTKPAGEEE